MGALSCTAFVSAAFAASSAWRGSASRNRVAAGFGLVLAVLLVSAFLSVVNLERLIAHERLVNHTNEVVRELEAVLADATAAETGQRGFLLAGPAPRQLDYLKPYTEAAARVHDRLRRLRELTRDNPAQQERLDALEQHVGAKLDELARTVALRRRRGFAAALEVVLTDEGQRHMDAIRATLGAMRDEEEELLQARARERGSAPGWPG